MCTDHNRKVMTKLNLENDDSLYERFKCAVECLATETGSLNKRLDTVWNDYLFVFAGETFESKELQEKFKFIEDHLSANSYLGLKRELKSESKKHLLGMNHCYLTLHYARAQKVARNIWDIYQAIVNTRLSK